MKTLPINLNLDGMPVLVIGGGAQALEKIEKILPYGPDVTVVSPALDAALAALAADGKIRYIADCYREAHLGGYRLVFAAVNDPRVTERIYRETRRHDVLLNAVDVPEFCDFIMPAVVQGRAFTLSIATGGRAAGLSRQLREQLEAGLTEEDELIDLLARLRAIFKRKHATFGVRRERLWAILRELEAIEQQE